MIALWKPDLRYYRGKIIALSASMCQDLFPHVIQIMQITVCHFQVLYKTITMRCATIRSVFFTPI